MNTVWMGRRMTRGRAGSAWAVVVAAWVAGAIGAASLTGCQTTKGLGEDIESLGETISDEADKASG